MSETKNLFSDGVQDIVVQNGVARIDLFAYSATEKTNDGKPAMDFQQRVVMPLPAFTQTFSAMERVMKELMERGVVAKADQKSADDAVAGSA